MSGSRKRLGVAFGGLVCTIAIAVPQAAGAGLVDGVLNDVQDSVDETVGGVVEGAGGGGSSSPVPVPVPTPAPVPVPQDATTTPELDGTNPHGEGAVLDATIENPAGDPIGVTVGQSRGEQDSDTGEYSGVVNILVLDNLPLIGDQRIGIETAEGESAESPIGPINAALDQVCTAGDVCLALLNYSSDTTKNGSENNFSAARADVLSGTVSAGVVESEGNISDDGDCQNAEGSATAANVGVASDAISADALESSSQSEACRDGSESASGDSQVVNLGALQALDPLSLIGCDPTAVDDEFEVPLLVSGVCNGDDTNGAQADAPYNTRTAIQIDVLEDVLGLVGADVDLDGSPSESLAVAPDDPDRPEPPDPPDPEDPRDPDDPNDPAGPGNPGGPTADSPDSLPFTGADLGTLGLIGALVMGSGLGLMTLLDRRRRTGS